MYLVNTAFFNADGTSYVTYVTDSFDASTEFDATTALEINERISLSVPENNPDRAFYVSRSSAPEIERYLVDERGEITFDKTMSLAGEGVTSANQLIEGLTFLSAEKAYFIDFVSLQVIEFNPTAMTITDAFSMDGLLEPNLKAPFGYFKNLDQGRIVVAGVYENLDDTSARFGKLAIINTNDNSVTYDSQDQCGGMAWTARDQEENIYWVSHTFVAINQAAGLTPEDHKPCMVRMKSGADGFDNEYYVNLLDMTEDNRPAGAMAQGVNGLAYTLVYNQTADTITPDNQGQLYRDEGWEYHSFELGNEAATFTKVPNVPGGVPYGISGTFNLQGTGDISYVTTVSADFSTSSVYNTTDPSAWQPINTVPGFIFSLFRLQ